VKDVRPHLQLDRARVEDGRIGDDRRACARRNPDSLSVSDPDAVVAEVGSALEANERKG
jgi:hypothetical protein